MNSMESRLTKQIDERVDTTNQNVQTQIADMDGRMQERRSE